MRVATAAPLRPSPYPRASGTPADLHDCVCIVRQTGRPSCQDQCRLCVVPWGCLLSSPCIPTAGGLRRRTIPLVTSRQIALYKAESEKGSLSEEAIYPHVMLSNVAHSPSSRSDALGTDIPAMPGPGYALAEDDKSEDYSRLGSACFHLHREISWQSFSIRHRKGAPVRPTRKASTHSSPKVMCKRSKKLHTASQQAQLSRCTRRNQLLRKSSQYQLRRNAIPT
jgi:hypothetical protein